MSMSFSHRLELSQRQEHRLTLERRLLLENHVFTLRLQLIGALREERYKPQAQCPQCSKKLTPIEIMNGFNQDPMDFTTCCPQCQTRFEPHIINFGRASSVELPFFCSVQALDQLRGRQMMSPMELSRHHPAVYRSAIIHHGTITKAFQEIGIEYLFPEISDWKKKAMPFLGRLSDRVIAECVEESATTISKMRRELGIERFHWSRALSESKTRKSKNKSKSKSKKKR